MIFGLVGVNLKCINGGYLHKTKLIEIFDLCHCSYVPLLLSFIDWLISLSLVGRYVVCINLDFISSLLYQGINNIWRRMNLHKIGQHPLVRSFLFRKPLWLITMSYPPWLGHYMSIQSNYMSVLILSVSIIWTQVHQDESAWFGGPQTLVHTTLHHYYIFKASPYLFRVGVWVLLFTLCYHIKACFL